VERAATGARLDSEAVGGEAGGATRVRDGARTRQTGGGRPRASAGCLTRWGLGILRAGNGAHVVPRPGPRRSGGGVGPCAEIKIGQFVSGEKKDAPARIYIYNNNNIIDK